MAIIYLCMALDTGLDHPRESPRRAIRWLYWGVRAVLVLALIAWVGTLQAGRP